MISSDRLLRIAADERTTVMPYRVVGRAKHGAVSIVTDDFDEAREKVRDLDGEKLDMAIEELRGDEPRSDNDDGEPPLGGDRGPAART